MKNTESLLKKKKWQISLWLKMSFHKEKHIKVKQMLMYNTTLG